MTSAAGSMNAQGRVSIPAPIRRELGLSSDTPLVTYIEDGRVILETRADLPSRIQKAATEDLPAGESVVDELIADRRWEAVREAAELHAQTR